MNVMKRPMKYPSKKENIDLPPFMNCEFDVRNGKDLKLAKRGI